MKSAPLLRLLLFLALLAAALLLGGLAGWLLRGGSAADAGDAHQHGAAPAGADGAEQAAEWTCSMHPQIRSPQPGQCPICGMDLIPVPQGGGAATDPRSLPLSAAAAALAAVETVAVERRGLQVELRLVGKIAYDETRLTDLTAWMPGRLDRLFVDSTGVPVRAGEHMVEIYSPKLYAAQEELLQASRAAERLADSPLAELREATAGTLVAARQKLRLLGLSEEQIAEVLRSGAPQERLTLRAPAGGVVIERLAQEGGWVGEGAVLFRIADLRTLWLELDAYESDLAWLRAGQPVRFTVAAYPGESFEGRISLIHPMLRTPSRTVRVRVVVENEDLRLKPGMFATARVAAAIGEDAAALTPDLSGLFACPMHPEVLMETAGDCPLCGMPLEPAGAAHAAGEDPLAIPASAPLLTGERAIVYVAGGTPEQPTFEARQIVLGPRAGDWYPVLDGLAAGERVVARGAFRLDSELQIRGGESMMHPPAPAAEEPVRVAAPAAFRASLGRALAGFAAVAQALAADDEAAARAALAPLEAAIAAVDADALPAAHRGHGRRMLEAFADAAVAMRSGADLAGLRAGLWDAARAAIGLADAFGYASPDGREFAVMHCPMARDDRGGDWIQYAGSELLNPYFGAAMLYCGEEMRAIPSGDPR